MGKAEFAKEVIRGIEAAVGRDGAGYTEATPALAAQAAASAIGGYIKRNASVGVAYAGVVPSVPPSPDPLVSDTFGIEGEVPPPGPCAGFDEWLAQIEAGIVAGLRLSASGRGGLSFRQSPFSIPGIPLSRDALSGLHQCGDESPQQKVWEAVCGAILDWASSIAPNTAPGPASNPATMSSGTAFITRIDIA